MLITSLRFQVGVNRKWIFKTLTFAGHDSAPACKISRRSVHVAELLVIIAKLLRQF